jgi:hypothetical protein
MKDLFKEFHLLVYNTMWSDESFNVSEQNMSVSTSWYLNLAKAFQIIPEDGVETTNQNFFYAVVFNVRQQSYPVRFEVLLAVNIKITAFVASIRVYSSFLNMEAASPSRILVPIYQTTWHHIPQD